MTKGGAVTALAITLSCLLVLSSPTPAQPPPKIGPTVGLRLPLWDLLYKRYWTETMRLDWDRSFGLRDNTDMTRTLYVKTPALVAGAGIVTAYPANGDGQTMVAVDTAVVLTNTAPGVTPVEGADCYGSSSSAVRVTQAGVFFCVGPEPRRPDATGWKWRRLAWQASLPPVAGTPCGDGRTWSQQAGMYLCRDQVTANLAWALVPMQ